MKRIFTLLVLGSLLAPALGQQEITGTVTDGENGEGLPGVSIMIRGTTTGTISGSDGSYTIRASRGQVLFFSFIGYNSQEVELSGNTRVDISLLPASKDLDEVVVIGYGTQRKSDITGSVSSIRSDDFNPGPVVNIDNMLQSTAPGVVLLQSSSQPGGGFDVKVRGTSSLLGNNGPLYVVDGLPITSDNTEPGSSSRYRSSPARNPLNSINPEDIVAIEVLKDASATAIYGSRGANGVILITTRSGKEGKLQVDYSGSFSLQQLAREYDMLNAEEFARLTNEYHLEQNPGSDPIYSPAEINTMGEGTAWMDEILRLGTINKHQLALQGGSEKLNYYVSGNYYSHRGIVQDSKLDRYTGKVNLAYSPLRSLRLGMNLSATRMHDVQVSFGATSGGGPEFSGLFDNTRTWSPLVEVYQDDGSFSRHPVVDNIPNPVSLLDIDDQIYRNRILGTTWLEYTLAEKLTARLNFGFDHSASEREAFIPTTVIRGQQANGEAEFATTGSQNLLGEFTLTWESDLAGNPLTVLAGATAQQFDSEGENLLIVNFADHAESIDEIVTADTLSNPLWKEQSRLLSYLGRVNYNLKDRYLFTLSFRADGSTKFGPNNKWGFFPSGAFAWKIHNEDFFSSDRISTLKFRLSYGQIGNQEIGNKRSQSLYSYSRRYVIGGEPVSGLASLRPENRDLRWETSTQANAGLDLGFMDGRVQATLDAYHKITSDVLLEYYLPSTSGYSVITTNAGMIRNMGVELGLNAALLSGQDGLQWRSTLNIAYNRNNWMDRAGFYPAGEEIEEENAVVNGTYGYEVEGIFRDADEVAASKQPGASPGMFRFRDVNGDGDITPADRTLLGKNDPDVMIGLNNLLTWRKFDLGFFLQGMIGRVKDNYTLADLENIQNLLSAYNKSESILDRWTVSNPEGSIHGGAAPTDGGDNYNNSHYIQNASFLRARNLTIGYTTSELKHFRSLRAYVDIQNLFILSPYRGIDPETDEFRQYPNARTYTIGVNLSF